MYILIIDKIKHIRIDSDRSNFPYFYKGIEITRKDSSFYMSLSKDFHITELSSTIKLEYRKYLVEYNDNIDHLEVYVYENANGINEYHLYRNQSFIMGNNQRATIIPHDELMNGKCLYLSKNILKTNADCLSINGEPYNGEELVDNDEIDFYNLRFIYHHDFLYMNNFMTTNKLEKVKLNEYLFTYKLPSINLKNYYFPNKKELVIDDLKSFKPPTRPKEKKMIFQIGPSMTMSLAMLSIAGINVYNNYLNNQSILNSLIYILMPVTMLLSGVIWPIIATNSEKIEFEKEYKLIKNNYHEYLLTYKNDINKKIADYLSEENSYFFNGEIDKDKLFSITNKNNSFLDLSLGYTTRKIELKYEKAGDIDIVEEQSRINYRLNSIENVPLYLNILDYKTISIVSKAELKDYLIKSYLLELSSKYNIDDFYLALYTKDIYKYVEYFCLPQLIYKNIRLTLDSISEVQELNNYSLDKPLVLFVDASIDIKFTNPFIHLLYFTQDMSLVYKDSEAVIEYQNDGIALLHKNDGIEFRYMKNDLGSVAELGNFQKLSYDNKEISFKDVYNNINIEKFYEANPKGLKAEFALTNNELLSFDLHETKNGPHGLIGGCTGSGKSELIVSMLLSLCIRYRPDYLNIILIDYKGAGIEDSLSFNAEHLPHIIASISNLESDIFERLIVSIDHECKRRQKLFKDLSNKALTSIMNLDDYLNNDYEKYGLPKIAHLLIVVDEFAELKKENPEVIKELVSFSRIGRSLGLHLILATQRPNGVIDDEIWSNSRFKIALKVLNESDSNDIIKCKDAASLTSPGEFYLLVDNNLVKAKAIYSKRDINNGDPYEVALLNNRLEVINKKKITNPNPLKEATYIVNRIIDVTRKMNIETDVLSFDKPQEKTESELKEIYHVDNEYFILGESDNYLNNLNEVVKVKKNENILIYTTKAKTINSILNHLYRQSVVIGSKEYHNNNIVNSFIYDDTEDINFLFNKINKTKDELTVVVEDLSTLFTYIDDISNTLYSLLRRDNNNINIIALTKQSAINYKLVNCFKYRYAIEIFDNQDLINIFSAYSKYKGKSYYFDEDIISFIPVKEEQFNSEINPNLKPYIEKIPDVIKAVENNGSILIGYDELTRSQIYYPQNKELLIVSYREDIVTSFNEYFRKYKNIKVVQYDKGLLKDEHNSILWIGDGIFSQRLFYMEGNLNLKDNQGYLIDGNSKKLIRNINHE